uniref:Uncharacterized protein n=1 Tax=Chrysemys picta bellii TaxID=8478 RepID=A0A8C3FE18_CHRPI
MPVFPLDELQLTETDPKTGKLRTSPALVSCVVFEMKTFNKLFSRFKKTHATHPLPFALDG